MLYAPYINRVGASRGFLYSERVNFRFFQISVTRNVCTCVGAVVRA